MSFPELVEQPLDDLLNLLADANPTPGGGAAAAAAGAMAAALLQMVAQVTLNRRRYEAGWPTAQAVHDRAADIQGQLALAISEDGVVYRQVVLLLSHHTDANSTTAMQAIEDALTAAAQVPLKVANLATELVQIGHQLVEVGNAHAAADAATACHLAAAAVKASVTNVQVNLRDVTDEKLKKRWINQALRCQADVEQLTANLAQLVQHRLNDRSTRGRRSRRPK
jgi:formiminotetrahydrofolate cyclodeaminase